MGLRAQTPDASKSDTRFLDALQCSSTRKEGEYPPLALAQIYIDRSSEMAKVRRLHLIVVDLYRPRRSMSRSFQCAFNKMACGRASGNTTPIPLVGRSAWRCRYAYGYGLDSSEISYYLLLPERTEEGPTGYPAHNAWAGSSTIISDSKSVGLEYRNWHDCGLNVRVSISSCLHFHGS